MTMFYLATISVIAGSFYGAAYGVNIGIAKVWKCMYLLQADSIGDQWKYAVASGAAPLGGILGPAFCAVLFHFKVSKRVCITLSGVVGLLSMAAQLRCSTYSIQLLGRFIYGIGIGMASTATPAYVSIMSPHKWRGTLGTLFQVGVNLMIFIGTLTDYFALTSHRDASDTAYCKAPSHTSLCERNSEILVPSIIMSAAVILISFIIPHEHISPPTGDEEDTYSASKATIPSAGKPERKWYTYKRQLVIGFVLSAALQFTGCKALILYISLFLQAADVSAVALGSVLVMAWNLLTTFPALFLIDHIGRRKLLLPTLFIMAASITLMTPASFLSGKTSAIVCFVLLVVFVGSYQVGIGSLYWTICNEIIPKHASIAFAVMNTTNWIFQALVTVLYPPLRTYFRSYVFLWFGITCFIYAIFVTLCLPETKGLCPSEIADHIERGWIAVRCCKPSYKSASSSSMQPPTSSLPSTSSIPSAMRRFSSHIFMPQTPLATPAVANTPDVCFPTTPLILNANSWEMSSKTTV